MKALFYLERWREGQLGAYLQAQIIDQLEQQHLLQEYRQAQTIDRLDQQNASLSLLGSILADTGTSVGLIQADIARLLAVTNQALPVIIDHLAVVGTQLANVEQLLAKPEETKAWEQFRSGLHALASAVETSEKGSQGLSAEWLDEAISDLSGAVGTYKYRPEFWYELGLAYARRGSAEDAAEAFSRSARYAVSASPEFAAWSVLLAAIHLRDIGQHAKAKDALQKFLRPLERCAEIHLNLAMYHGESDEFTRALKLAPLLALTALAALKKAGREDDIVLLEEAAAKVCRDEDGPVSRLRALEEAILDLAKAAEGVGLDCPRSPLVATDLPDFGVKALLKAERAIPFVAEQAKEVASGVRSGLKQLKDHAQDCQRRHQDAVSSGAKQIEEAQKQVAQAKERTQQASEARLTRVERGKHGAERALSQANKHLQEAIAKSVEAQRRLETYVRMYDKEGKLRSSESERLREIWRMGGVDAFQESEDFYDLVSWHSRRHGRKPQSVDWAWEHKVGPLRTGGIYVNYSIDEYVKIVDDWAGNKPTNIWKADPDLLKLIPSYNEYNRVSDGRGGPWRRVLFAEVVLYMVGEEGANIHAESEDAKRAVEHATARVQAAHESVERKVEIAELVRQLLARGEIPKALQSSEQEAERRCHQIAQQVEDKVRSAELEYHWARDVSQHAAEVISGFLQALDAAIQKSTSSRNRIIPSV